MVVKAQIKPAIKHQVPEFRTELDPTFIQFLESYYEFLESDNQALNIIRNLQSITDIDSTIDLYFDHLQNEIMPDIPRILYDSGTGLSINKVTLAKHINQFYANRGNEKSYQFLFKILYNEESEIFYPKQKLLYSSSGTWDYSVLLRLKQISGDIFEFLGKSVIQTNSNAEARIENIVKIQIDNDFIYECTVVNKSLIGLFDDGSNIKIKNQLDSPIAKIISVVNDFTIIDGGLYYKEGDLVDVQNYNNLKYQTAEIISINTGSLDNIIISNPGTNYRINQQLIFNTDSSVDPAIGYIQEIVRDSLKLENNSFLILENGNNLILENANTTGPIKTINLKYGGNFYKNLPQVLIAPLNSLNGSNAKLLATSTTIGSIKKIEPKNINNIIEDFNRSLYINLINRFVVDNISGIFVADEPITILIEELLLENGDHLLLEDNSNIILQHQENPIGTFKSLNNVTNLIEIKSINSVGNLLKEDNSGSIITENNNNIVLETSGIFKPNQTIIGSNSGATARLKSGKIANIDINIGTIFTTSGHYLDDFHKLGYDLRIQDSRFWQIYSYVIKSGQSINSYRTLVKKLLHPAGLALFGETQITSFISSKFRNIFGIIFKRLIEILIQSTISIAENVVKLRIYSSTTELNGSRTFGPSLKFIEQFKFNFAPYSGGDRYPLMLTSTEWNQIYPQNNSHYWDYANTQIKDFGDIILDDIINHNYKQTKFCPDSYVLITRTNPPPYFDSTTIKMDSTIETLDQN